jgi:hypothetical protein
MRNYGMIFIRYEWFSYENNRKLHARNAGPFKMLQRVGPNVYVLDLPLDFGISSTFNIDDLIAYQKPHSILNDLFEMLPNSPLDDPIESSTSFTLSQHKKIIFMLF